MYISSYLNVTFNDDNFNVCFNKQDTAVIEAHMEVTGKVMIDGMTDLEVIEATMANSMKIQVVIVIGHEVRLVEHIVINLQFEEPVVPSENLSTMILIRKMHLLQVPKYTHKIKKKDIYFFFSHFNLYNLFQILLEENV